MKVFSQFYHLTSDEKWKNEFQQGLSGYSSLAQKIPDGIGYALSAICENAVGILRLKFQIQCKFRISNQYLNLLHAAFTTDLQPKKLRSIKSDQIKER